MAAKPKPKSPPLRYSRIDFYRLRDFEFLESLYNFINAELGEVGPQRVKRWLTLSPQQQGVFAWWAFCGDVQNGGLAQFFYNQTDVFVPAISALLKTVGNEALPSLLKQAVALYRKHKKAFDTDQTFGDDGLFAQMSELAKLDRPVANKRGRASKDIEKWLRAHFETIALGDDGAPIDPKFSGEIESRYPSGNKTREQATVRRGVLTGAYRRYLPDGKLDYSCFYEAGKVSSNYWPNGQPKHKTTKHGKVQIDEWYFPSGKLQKRYVSDRSGGATEPVRLWYENGQLAEELHLKKGDKFGPWLKYFDDGAPKLEAEHRKGGVLIIKNAWDDRRQQIAKNGKGKFRTDEQSIDWEYDLFFETNWIREYEVRDGVPHGASSTWNHGVLWSTDDYDKGKVSGISTSFYDNGRVRRKSNYRNGKQINTECFPKYDNPIPAVILSTEANAELSQAWGQPLLDEYPTPQNLDKVQAKLALPDFLQEIYERHQRGETPTDDYESIDTFNDGVAYRVTVNEKGTVESVDFSGASAYSGRTIDVYPPFIQQIEFSPGRSGKRKVPSRVLVRVDHTFMEGKR